MKQNTIIGLISLFVVIVIGFFVFSNAKVSTAVSSLGGIAVGDYTLKTSTSGRAVICAAPCVLHRIITSKAADTFQIRDEAASSSVTPTSFTVVNPGNIDFDMNMVSGLTAYVTSTTGIIFVTSPR